MKSNLILLLLLAGCASAMRQSERGRRNGADPDVTAINCIASQCAMLAMPLKEQYQTLFRSWGEDPRAIRRFLVNMTTDASQLAKICTDYKTVIECPADKCTLTDDLSAIIGAIDWLDYPCAHQEDIRRHAACVMGVFADEQQQWTMRMREQVAADAACRNARLTFLDKYARFHSRARGFTSQFPTTGGSSSALRRRRQLDFTQVTVNPFPEWKRQLAEKFRLLPAAPTCNETLTMIDCVMKPIRDDCGADAATLIVETLKDITAKLVLFAKAFAPDADDKYPDVAKCLKDREDAATAFFKLFFF